MIKKIIISLVILIGVAFAWWNIYPTLVTKEVDDKLDPEIVTLLEQIDQESDVEVTAPENPNPAPEANYQTNTETLNPSDNVNEVETENNPTEPNLNNTPPQILPEVPESEVSDNQNTEPVIPEPIETTVTKPVTPPKAEVSLPEPPLPSIPEPIVKPATPSVSAKLPISHTPGHNASGNVRIIRMPDETIVRYENYQGTNGPDLRIYLSTDLKATDFVEISKAKGNMGNINYSVPDGVNIDDYNYVLTWCKPFRTLFDYAELDI